MQALYIGCVSSFYIYEIDTSLLQYDFNMPIVPNSALTLARVLHAPPILTRLSQKTDQTDPPN